MKCLVALNCGLQKHVCLAVALLTFFKPIHLYFCKPSQTCQVCRIHLWWPASWVLFASRSPCWRKTKKPLSGFCKKFKSRKHWEIVFGGDLSCRLQLSWLKRPPCRLNTNNPFRRLLNCVLHCLKPGLENTYFLSNECIRNSFILSAEFGVPMYLVSVTSKQFL